MAFTIYYGMHDLSREERAREAIHQVVHGAHHLGEVLIRQDREWLDEGSIVSARPGSWGTEYEPDATASP
jgi:hypothetical protein